MGYLIPFGMVFEKLVPYHQIYHTFPTRIKDFIFNYDILVATKTFNNVIIVFNILFKRLKSAKSLIFINIKINIELLIFILYKVKKYIIIKTNIYI